MNFLKRLKQNALPYIAAAALALGGSALANNKCVSNYGTDKNPTGERAEYVLKLDGAGNLEKMPDTVSVNLQGDRPYSLEELMGLKYIVAYGYNNGEGLIQYGEGNNLTLLNPYAQKVTVVNGVIDSKEEAEAIANLLNYCGVESKTPFDKLTDEVERMITTYQQKTNEEIKDLKLKLDEFGKLQLEINNKITYELEKITDLENRVTALEKEEEKGSKFNTALTAHVGGLWGSNSSVGSENASGFGFEGGITLSFDYNDLTGELNVSYVSNSLKNSEQEGSNSTLSLSALVGRNFNDFNVSIGGFYDIIQQNADATDYRVKVTGEALGPLVKLSYNPKDSFGFSIYAKKSLTGSAHQNSISLGKSTGNNALLDETSFGGDLRVPIAKLGDGTTVYAYLKGDLTSTTTTYNGAIGPHTVNNYKASAGLVFNIKGDNQ